MSKPFLGFPAAPENPFVEWTGNSIAVILALSVVAASTFSKPVVFVNDAAGGQTTEGMNAGFTTVPKSTMQHICHQKVVVFAWEGRNSIATNGDSGATALSQMTTFVNNTLALAATLGMNVAVVVGTLLPSTSVGESDRSTYNAGIAALANGTTVFVADFASDPTMGPAGANNNTTYYSDGVHPTAAGELLLMPYAQSAVNAALAALG